MPEQANNPTTQHFSFAMPRQKGTLLGLDYSQKRLGIATGELETGQAHSLETIVITDKKRLFARLAELIKEWSVVGIVVGLPLTEDGQEQPNSLLCRRFANQLDGRFQLPVTLVDERYTSNTAMAELRDADITHRGKNKVRIDAVAAKVILQNYLDISNEHS